jgi:ubiquinone/menaquinone biosynthesis C-methylase UbiE
MYRQSARLYDKLYHFKDYAGEAARLHAWIQERHPGSRTLLDVGCGTGRHLEHLREHYACEGLDLNEELLEAARRRCPEVRFHALSMVDFALPRRYDVVTCLFSAIACAARSEDVLLDTLGTLTRHLERDGLVIVEPWFTPERYWTDTITANFFEEPNFKLAWMYHSTREGDVAVLDIQYLVGTPEKIEHFRERHELGLFADETYRRSFVTAGLTDVRREPDAFGRGLYFGRKP